MLVLATSISMINASKKDVILDYILYIYNLIYFQKSNNNIKTLINLSSEINTISSIFIFKLSFQV